MTAIPLPGARLLPFADFLDWKPEQQRYELHNGTLFKVQPTGDREEVICSPTCRSRQRNFSGRTGMIVLAHSTPEREQ